MSASNFLELEILDHILGGADYTRPATVYLAASTADPGETGSGLAEPSGNNYSRVSVTNNATNWPAASAGSKSNGTAMAFPTASGSWGTITHLAIMDAPTGGNLLFKMALTAAQAVGAGATLNFPIGNITITCD